MHYLKCFLKINQLSKQPKSSKPMQEVLYLQSVPPLQTSRCVLLVYF